MIEISGKTIGVVFDEAAEKFAGNPFVMRPAFDGAGIVTITYAHAHAQVSTLSKALREAGYGHGHRLAVLMGNRLEHLILKLAFNALGISIVPVNADYRPAEIAYLLDDSGCELAFVEAARVELLNAGIAEAAARPKVVVWEEFAGTLPVAVSPAPNTGPVNGETEASLIYTSGTTGRPKGCRLGHEYELMVGERYVEIGGIVTFGEGVERVFNPLPLFHINAMIVSFIGVMLTGNCQIQPERFSKSNWWRDVRDTGATMIHYLGVIVPALLSEPEGEGDRDHGVGIGLGAGVEPSLHDIFEKRFGFPIVEVWGMTEMCRIFAATEEPRQIDTRAFGRPFDGLEVRVVDEEDLDVPRGTPGEFLVRHSEATPRRGAYLGYLNKPDETEAAWRGGWFHTGDTVMQDETGMVYFVDRKKNIIRRSGENIAAAEIEACLYEDDRVAQVAVIAAPDELRDEEVFACIVPVAATKPDKDLAEALFDHCFGRLSYYKAPGWILFVDALPVTGTQKVLKHKIFPDGVDPREQPGAYEFRERKKR